MKQERGVRAEVCTVSLTRREELQRNHLDRMLRSAEGSLFSDLPGWEERGRRIGRGSGGSRSPGIVRRLGGERQEDWEREWRIQESRHSTEAGTEAGRELERNLRNDLFSENVRVSLNLYL